MIWLDLVVIVCVIIAYFKCNTTGKKISLIIGGVYSIAKGIICCMQNQTELIPMYIVTLFLCGFFLYYLIARKSSDKIILPIGECSVTGDKDNYEICIVTDGKQYKFGVEGDKITTYKKNGNWERYGC